MPLVTAFNLHAEDPLDRIEVAVRDSLASLPEQQIHAHEVDFVPVVKPDGFHGTITRINIDLWERPERTKEWLQEAASRVAKAVTNSTRSNNTEVLRRRADRLIVRGWRATNRARKGLRITEEIRSAVHRYEVRRLTGHPAIVGGAGTSRDLFRCESHNLDGVMCVAVAGELDLASAETFRAHLRIAADKSNAILLDFSRLRYMDSSGVNALLVARQQLSHGKGRLALVGVSRGIGRILGVLKVEQLIPVYRSVEEALTYLRLGADSELPEAGA